MPDLYLIEKRGLYYRPDAAGYTCFKHEAGRYTLDEVAQYFPNHDSPNQDGMTFVALDDAPDVSKAGGFEGRLRFDLHQANQRAEKAEAAQISQATKDVLEERERQKSVEGWIEEHDDKHHPGVLSDAAACYAACAFHNWPNSTVPELWPWDIEWWKPTNPRRDLVKAAALILAEIDRIDRKVSQP